jgi:hypothetical protein
VGDLRGVLDDALAGLPDDGGGAELEEAMRCDLSVYVCEAL